MTSEHETQWEGRSVLVSGAGGFIGSHLVERLAHAGAHVRAFVRYTSSGRAGFVDDIEPVVRSELNVILGDLRDEDAVRHAVEGVDAVFHLGALIGIPYSYVHPRETADTNIGGTLNVLLAARDLRVGRVVLTSSSEVYGTALHVPIDERHPLQAQSPYAASKIAADKLGESFSATYGTPIVVLRPFNTYGPRQSARAVIPTIVTQALAGDEVVLGNLLPTRDFTYVADTVDGFLAAGASEAAVGRVINLGTGNEISIGDLAALIGEILGRELSVRQEGIRIRPDDSEVERLLSDNRLARELLGWEPKTPLREGLTTTVEWIEHNLPRYRVGTHEI
jgi:NAD dependent epimerase/dehydratase